MDTKLIMVEGIPGSGKSTFAGRIADFYTGRGFKTRLYLEGDSHPADLAWQACIPAKEADTVLAPYAAIRKDIDRHTRYFEGYAVVAYTKVQTDNVGFYQDMERFEVCDNRVPLDLYRGLHQKRWAVFGIEAAEKENLNIFECAFFQNQLTELLLFRLFDRQSIKAYFMELIRTVEELHPVLVYLSQPDIRETVERTARQRISEHGSWIDDFIRYFENAPYGEAHGIKGLEGALQCLEERKSMELEILRDLPIRTILLERSDYDWEAMWKELEARLPV